MKRETKILILFLICLSAEVFAPAQSITVQGKSTDRVMQPGRFYNRSFYDSVQKAVLDSIGSVYTILNQKKLDVADFQTGMAQMSAPIMTAVSQQIATSKQSLAISGTMLSISDGNSVALPTSIGPTGPQGLTGLTGPTGATGATGPAGVVTATGTAPLTLSYNSGTQAISGSISAATTSAAGTMSAADKTKLDGIATGATANTGTVTSVALSSSDLTVTGSPVTSSGTFTVNLNNVATAGTYGIGTYDTRGRFISGKRQELYSGTTNASGLYNVTFPTSYSVAPNIQAQLIGGTDLTFFRIVSVSTTGFSIYAFTRSSITSLPIVGTLTAALLGSAGTALSGANIDVIITEK